MYARRIMTVHAAMTIDRNRPLTVHLFGNFSHGMRVQLLLHDGLSADDLSEALQPRGLQPAGRIRFQRGDNARFGDLVGAGIFHVDGLQEQHVRFGIRDARGDGFHDFAVDGLFVVGHEVLVEQFLDLIGRKPRERKKR